MLEFTHKIISLINIFLSLKTLKQVAFFIEDNVWIGPNVFITPRVVKGNNTVIDSNSIVTKHIEPFTIAGGVPAKFIRKKKTYA